MPGGGQLILHLEPHRDPPPDAELAAGSYLCLEVRDHGGGIAAADVGRVFEPFFTTKGIGEGTGLGLSISQEIVREHGGCITAESQPGTGARFRIHLPEAEVE
jgi:signal transduction histidine kinase